MQLIDYIGVGFLLLILYYLALRFVFFYALFFLLISWVVYKFVLFPTKKDH